VGYASTAVQVAMVQAAKACGAIMRLELYANNNSSSFDYQARATFFNPIFSAASALSCLFFGFLPSRLFFSFLLIKVFIAQRITLLKFAVFDFNGEKSFTFPAFKRTLKNIFDNKKAAIRITGRTFDCYLH